MSIQSPRVLVQLFDSVSRLAGLGVGAAGLGSVALLQLAVVRLDRLVGVEGSQGAHGRVLLGQLLDDLDLREDTRVSIS